MSFQDLTWSSGKFGATVIIKVGKEAESFTVHKSLLCDTAAYFRAALEGGFLESQTQILELPEDDPSAVEHFLLWLYNGDIFDEDENPESISWELLVKIYLFGQARGIPRLQNDAIDKFIDKERRLAVLETKPLRMVYDHTAAGSPMRRLYVDLAAYGGLFEDGLWFDDKSEYPKEYLIDLIKAQHGIHKSKNKPPEIDFQQSRSNYHVEIPKAGGKEKKGQDTWWYIHKSRPFKMCKSRP